MSTTSIVEARIKYVENLFGVSGMPLLIPKRELIGEGVMLKICRRKPKQRHFFLFNDILVYGNIIIFKKKLISQHVFELESLTVEEVIGNENYPFQFKVMTPKKSFVICAATAEERMQWILHIRKNSKECERKTLARNLNNDNSLSPVWIPDTEAMKCMSCLITEFSWIQRRHHCRSCGNVVCSKCSQQKIHLPSQSNAPLRVCYRCFLNNNIKTTSDPDINGRPNDLSSTSSTDSD